MLPGTLLDYNLSNEEWLAMRGLAEDPNVIIKPADKGSCVVVWDQEDYIAETDNLRIMKLMKAVALRMKI